MSWQWNASGSFMGIKMAEDSGTYLAFGKFTGTMSIIYI